MGVSSRLLCALSVLLLGAAGGLGQPASTQPLIDGLSIGGMSGLAMLLQQAGLPVPEALVSRGLSVWLYPCAPSFFVSHAQPKHAGTPPSSWLQSQAEQLFGTLGSMKGTVQDM